MSIDKGSLSSSSAVRKSSKDGWTVLLNSKRSQKGCHTAFGFFSFDGPILFLKQDNALL